MIHSILQTPKAMTWIDSVAELDVFFAIITSIIAVIISLVALMWQRKSIQYSLFQDVGSRIAEVEDQQVDVETISDEIVRNRSIKNWYIRLFNAYERFAYFVHEERFTKEQALFHGESLIARMDEAVKECPLFKEDMENRLKDTDVKYYSEIKKYYKSQTGREAPF